MWPLFRYAAERNGGLDTAAGGAALMKAMWANIAAGQPAITAYDGALKTKGTDLNTTFHSFAISMRFMKGCATAAPYCFSDGPGILANKGSLPGNQGAVAAVGGSYSGTVSNTYAANWVSLPSTGTYSVQLNNTSTGGILRASIVADMGDLTDRHVPLDAGQLRQFHIDAELYGSHRRDQCGSDDHQRADQREPGRPRIELVSGEHRAGSRVRQLRLLALHQQVGR